MNIRIEFMPNSISEGVKPYTYTVCLEPMPDRMAEWFRVEVCAAVEHLRRLITFYQAKGDF